MILITGGTGFVGQHLIPLLVKQGASIRILIRPSNTSPKIPRGVPVELAICNINDPRGLRAALKNISTVIHLASTERKGSQADLNGIDIEGSRSLIEAISAGNPVPIIYLSHLKATRSSAYPVLKTKAIVENLIKHSGLPYLIMRSAIMYGKGDQFTEPLTRYIRKNPFFIGLPEGGKALVQPISVMDVANCISLSLLDEKFRMKTVELGGLEYFSYRQIIEILLLQMKRTRQLVNVSPLFVKNQSLINEQLFGGSSISLFFWDYIAENHTCPLDSVTTNFGIIPARLQHSLGYLPERK